MIIRNHLQSSVCALVIFALVSFGMIFVISLTLIEKLHNQIHAFTPLTMGNQTTWG